MEKWLHSFYTVRFGDCDPFGHLNNARYIDYFLNAREDQLRDYYQLKLTDYAKRGLGWVASSHEIVYLRPANYNDTVCIQSVVIELGESHLLVEMQLLDEARQAMKAIMWSKFTCINLQTGRKEKHPDDFMKFARQVVVNEIDLNAGLQARINSLKNR